MLSLIFFIRKYLSIRLREMSIISLGGLRCFLRGYRRGLRSLSGSFRLI